MSARIIDEAFPYQVCINLDRRRERWQLMRRKFAQHGIHAVRRFSAFDGDQMTLPGDWMHTPGAYGCLMSHPQFVREAKRIGASNVLIFEDDVVFDDQLRRSLATTLNNYRPIG